MRENDKGNAFWGKEKKRVLELRKGWIKLDQLW